MWSKRHRDLARLRCQAYRLHAVLCEVVPGGVSKAITAAAASALLDSITPAGPVQAARHQFTAEYAADLRQIDDKLRDTRKKITAAVRASGTTLTDLFRVGPVIAATIFGDVANVSGSPAATSSPPTTTPPRSRRPQESARSSGCPGAATGGRTTPSTWPPSPRSASHTAQAAPTTTRLAKGKTPKEALRALKRRVSDAIYAPSRPTPARYARRPQQRAREGNRGTTLSPARPAHTPHASSSDNPLPDPKPGYARPRQQHRRTDPASMLDNKEELVMERSRGLS